MIGAGLGPPNGGHSARFQRPKSRHPAVNAAGRLA